MFVTENQLFVAAFLFGAGYLLGIILNFIYFFINKISSKILRGIVQFLPFFILFLTYAYCYFKAKLPNYALYMPVVFLLGCFIERKTLHTTLAYCFKKLYNSIVKRG